MTLSQPEPTDRPSIEIDQAAPTPDDPNSQLIWTDPERLSGAPCFAGTRVPIQTLWDYLEAGDSLEEFLEGFPGVAREQAVAVLELARERVLAGSWCAQESFNRTEING